MPQPEKTKRNKEMYRKRKKGMSFGDLASFYGIAKPTVFDIIKREEKKMIETVRSI